MTHKTAFGCVAAGWWLMRAGLVAGVLLLWGFSRWFPPSPAFQGALLALTLLGGAVLFARGFLPVRWGRSGQPAVDTLLGLASAAAALAFLFLVLDNQEGPLPVLPASSSPSEKPERLRIVDFNVLHGIPDFPDQEGRFQDTLAAFRVLDPDIVILQEVWDTTAHGNLARRLGEALPLHWVYARANGSRPLLGFEEGAAILSRFPILAAQRLLLSPRRPWWECRIAVLATIDLAGEKLTVAGLHCHDQNEAIAAAQARSLLSRLDRSAMVLVAGDFNAGSDAPAVTQFRQAGFMDVLPGGIDHLLLPGDSGAWKVVSASWTLRPEDVEKLIGKQAVLSDHPAIVVELMRER